MEDGILVTLPKKESRKSRGRPASPAALSPAEKQQRYRERKETLIMRLALNLRDAKKTGDWSAVEAVADALARI
jgi:hypothetical protein